MAQPAWFYRRYWNNENKFLHWLAYEYPILATGGSGGGGYITSVTSNGFNGPSSVNAGVLNIPVYSDGQVTTVFGRQGNVLAQSGDYVFSQIGAKPTSLLGYGISDPIILASGSYANPSWISSLAYGKLIGGPTNVSFFSNDAGYLTAGSATYPVNSVFGRTGDILPASGDYTTTFIAEGTNLYYTNDRGISSVLTAYAASPGTVDNTDSIISAIQKLDGNLTIISSGIFLNTSQVAELGNLYFTNARVLAASLTSYSASTGTISPTDSILSSIEKLDGNAQAISTSTVPEGTNLYYTNTRVINSPLTGFISGAGTVSSTDSILSAFQKVNGNIAVLITGVASVYGRNGAVTAQSGDYIFSQIGSTPTTILGYGITDAYSNTNPAGYITAAQVPVQSIFGRTGAIIAVTNDYNTSQVPESGNLYFTTPRVLGTIITGYVPGAGTVTSTDTIVQALGKIVGNFNSYTPPAAPVSSVFGRTGAIVATASDYTTSLINEGSNLYYTNARGITSILSGYVSGAGVVANTDSVIAAIQKLNGNIAATNLDGVLATGGTFAADRTSNVNNHIWNLTNARLVVTAPYAPQLSVAYDSSHVSTISTNVTGDLVFGSATGLVSFSSPAFATMQVSGGSGSVLRFTGGGPVYFDQYSIGQVTNFRSSAVSAVDTTWLTVSSAGIATFNKIAFSQVSTIPAITLATPSVAVLNTQQNSPYILFQGSGWASTPAIAKTTALRIYGQVVQGVANPYTYLSFGYSVAGAAYTDFASFGMNEQVGYPVLSFPGQAAIYNNGGAHININGNRTTFPNNTVVVSQVLSVGTATVNATLTLAASVVGRAQMNLIVGVPPTSPNDGDIWREDNTNTGVKIRVNGVTKTLSLV